MKSLKRMPISRPPLRVALTGRPSAGTAILSGGTYVMKKIVSIIIVVALIMPLAIVSFAAQPDTVAPQACSHTWGPETTSTSWDKYNDSQCKKTVTVTRVCTKCAEIDRTVSVTCHYHQEAVRSASCNGTTQTHIYNCPNCGTYRYTTWVACPGANINHQSGCQWLPV